MSRLQNSEPRHDAKALWRSTRKLGDSLATFAPGEELRCPGILRIPQYVGPCGNSFSGEFAKPHTRVILRVRHHGNTEFPHHPGTYLRCHKCGTALEKITILEVTG